MSLAVKEPNTKPTVGISACLIGEAVRYDGADKRHSLLNEVLGPHVDLHPFCPEVAAGLGVPRPAVRLEQHPNSVLRARGVIDRSLDVTEQLIEVSTSYLLGARDLSLCGFIFQSRSPSCGLASTPIYSAVNGGSEPLVFGSGIFATHIHSQLSHVVCIEDTWLSDADQCYLFLAAVTLTQGHHFSKYIDPELIALILDRRTDIRNQGLGAQVERCLAILMVSSSNRSSAIEGHPIEKSAKGLSLRDLSLRDLSLRNHALTGFSLTEKEKAALNRRLSDYFETQKLGD